MKRIHATIYNDFLGTKDEEDFEFDDNATKRDIYEVIWNRACEGIHFSLEEDVNKMLDIEKEISTVVDNDLLDSLLFYGCEYREYRKEIFEEFEKQCVNLIRKVKKELDEHDEM